MLEREVQTFSLEHIQASKTVELCQSLQASLLEQNDPVIQKQFGELQQVLESHQGSSFLSKTLERTYLPRIMQTPNDNFLEGLPDLLGIYIDTPEDQEERSRVNNLYGIHLSQKENKFGIFTKEGAKQFELNELVTIIPSTIKSAVREGRIGDAERNIQLLREGATNFKKHYNEDFTNQDNLSVIISDPVAQQKWIKDADKWL